MHIEIKELNKKIKEKGVSKELAVRLKQRRRTLKNRNYATRYPQISANHADPPFSKLPVSNVKLPIPFSQCSDPDAL